METKYLYDNLRYLTKVKKVRMADIEYPLRAGWISRLHRRNTINKLSIECLYNASKLLGVSMEDLIELDLASKYKTEYIKAEIEKLREEANILEERLKIKDEKYDPCNECLDEGGREETTKPLYFEQKED